MLPAWSGHKHIAGTFTNQVILLAVLLTYASRSRCWYSLRGSARVMSLSMNMIVKTSLGLSVSFPLAL